MRRLALLAAAVTLLALAAPAAAQDDSGPGLGTGLTGAGLFTTGMAALLRATAPADPATVSSLNVDLNSLSTNQLQELAAESDYLASVGASTNTAISTKVFQLLQARGVDVSSGSWNWDPPTAEQVQGFQQLGPGGAPAGQGGGGAGDDDSDDGASDGDSDYGDDFGDDFGDGIPFVAAP